MRMHTFLNSVGLLLYAVILMGLYLEIKIQELNPWVNKHQRLMKANMKVLD